jgi:hypothetical protein
MVLPAVFPYAPETAIVRTNVGMYQSTRGYHFQIEALIQSQFQNSEAYALRK